MPILNNLPNESLLPTSMFDFDALDDAQAEQLILQIAEGHGFPVRVITPATVEAYCESLLNHVKPEDRTNLVQTTLELFEEIDPLLDPQNLAGFMATASNQSIIHAESAHE